MATYTMTELFPEAKIEEQVVLPNLCECADNAAAITMGCCVGQIYRTSAGEVRVVV